MFCTGLYEVLPFTHDQQCKDNALEESYVMLPVHAVLSGNDYTMMYHDTTVRILPVVGGTYSPRNVGVILDWFQPPGARLFDFWG